MNPQDNSDFSKLSCWFFSTSGKEFAIERLLNDLNIKTLDAAVPQKFIHKMKMKFTGPEQFLPQEPFPDLVLVNTYDALPLVKFIKQQSPSTYVISIAFSKMPYADLGLRRDDILSQAGTGLVRGKILRHLNAMT